MHHELLTIKFETMNFKRKEPLQMPPNYDIVPGWPHDIEINEDFFQEKNQWHFDRSEEPKRKILLDNLFTTRELKKLRK